MSMLLFMPWCRIDDTYKVGDIEILPFKRHKPLNSLDDAAQCRVNTIMASYKNIEDRLVDAAALVRYPNKSPINDLTEDEIETAYELAALACFCGLAKREFFNPVGPYCNSDCFTLYTQKFEKADSTTFVTRRREGQTLSVWPIDEIAITIPLNCHGIHNISLDNALLDALVTHRTGNNSYEWARWQNAISCFNQANTDSYNVSHQVEWVLLCSAFEHLLGAKSSAVDVASKFAQAMVPEDSLLASDANRRLDNWRDNRQSLRYEWMREFYRIRGDFAHGKLKTRQPTVWNQFEHLVLATIAFPLLVKCLLSKDDKYTLTDKDRSHIDCFEKFADTNDFRRQPPNQQGSLDSHWARILEECNSRLIRKAAAQALEEMRKKK